MPYTSATTPRHSRHSLPFSSVYFQVCSNFGAATPQNQQPTVHPLDSSKATGACTIWSARSWPSSPMQRLIIRSRQARSRDPPGRPPPAGGRRARATPGQAGGPPGGARSVRPVPAQAGGGGVGHPAPASPEAGIARDGLGPLPAAVLDLLVDEVPVAQHGRRNLGGPALPDQARRLH